MKTFFPKDLSDSDLYAFFTSAVVPRPIALVSTIDDEGIKNLAPYSYCNMVSTHPPVIFFAPVRISPPGQPQKDTYENLKNQKECVIHFCDVDMAEVVNHSAIEFPHHISEFEECNLTPLPSDMVKPYRVKEAPIAFECKLIKIVELGIEPRAGSMMLCEIIKIHIQKDILDDRGRVSPLKHRILARLGGNTYAAIQEEDIFSLERERYINKE